MPPSAPATLTALERDSDLGLDTESGRIIAHELDLVLGLGADLGTALDSAFALTCALDVNRGLAHDVALRLARDLARGFGRGSIARFNFDSVLAHAFNRDLALTALGRDLAHALTFTASLDCDVTSTKPVNALLGQRGWPDLDSPTRLGLEIAYRDLLRAHQQNLADSPPMTQGPGEGISRVVRDAIENVSAVHHPIDDPSAVLVHSISTLANSRPGASIVALQITAAARLITRARYQGVTRDLCDATVCVMAAINRISLADANSHLARSLGGVLGSLIARMPDEDQHPPTTEPPPGVALVRA
ncbi:hypothetical protein ACIBO5_50495 [Nonomuraea angiospora]|uniref:hypothetical protein n=1 Tax=Nonomuraea angiospora TaxID=46172 RepID=UPI003792DB26